MSSDEKKILKEIYHDSQNYRKSKLGDDEEIQLEVQDNKKVSNNPPTVKTKEIPYANKTDNI
jgi:hypothetical protein